MEVLFITRVRKIAKGKTVDGVAQDVNIVVLDLTGGKPSIVRNYSQFLQDLKNSFLIDDNINNINHPQVTRVLRGLKRGNISGEINFTKKGDKFTVTENSRAITDPTHPEFGKVSVGDVRISEEDRAIVEGFLDIEPNEQYQTVQATAEATAQAKMAMAGAFENFGSSANDGAVPEELEDTIPSAILDEALDNNKETKKTK